VLCVIHGAGTADRLIDTQAASAAFRTASARSAKHHNARRHYGTAPMLIQRYTMYR